MSRRRIGPNAMAGSGAVGLLAVALVFAGGAFDTPSLFVPGLGLGVLDAALFIFVSAAARSARLELFPFRWSVIEGEINPLPVRIEGRFPRGLAHLEHPLRCREPVRPSATGDRMEIDIAFSHPGRADVPPARLVLADPLGLHRRVVSSERGPTVLVLPRIEEVTRPGNLSGLGGLAAAGVEGTAAHGQAGAGLDRGSVDFEPDGLRPYRPGGSASRIHWATVARTGEYLEHRLLSGGDDAAIVILDTSGGHARDPVERCIRAATSLAHALAKERSCVLVLPGVARPLRLGPGLRGWDDAHALLAQVEADRVAPMHRGLSRTHALFVVTPAASTPPALEGLRLGGAGYLVSPSLAPGTTAELEVAGCTGRRLAPARQAGTRARAAA